MCDLWRKVRLEVTEQAFGRANRGNEQAKVFKAHAIPLVLCEKLINALKLLANQDGDGLLQSIVTNLGKGSRKGLTHGLRDFIKVDNHRALEVGELHRGTGTFKVRKLKVPKGGRMSGKVLMNCR